ncbi:MAG: PAS domain-containing protein [Pseudoxanthomonas sp.]
MQAITALTQERHDAMAKAKKSAADSAVVPNVERAADSGGIGAVIEVQGLFELLKPVVELFGRMIGDNVEVVLHDLSTPGASVLAIANGHVTGRSVGDPILSGPREDAGFRELYRDVSRTGQITCSIVDEYQTTNASGRRLRSGTLLFRDHDGVPVAALCLNADMTVFEMAHGWLEQMLHKKAQPHRVDAPNGEVALDVIMQEIIDDAVKRFMKPPEMMNKEEKMYAVEAMMQRGLFLIRNSVEQVAAALGVSRFTIYNYIEQIKQKSGPIKKISPR